MRDMKKKVHYTRTSSLPWVSRMICRFLFHSHKGVINSYGALEWIVCTRCGHKRSLIGDPWCEK